MSSDYYKVKPITDRKKEIVVSVPGSKSITNRALLISALAEGESKLYGALFSNDALDMIRCLKTLGIEIDACEEKKEILVKGCNGKLPVTTGTIHVGNAGTAARFITALVAFSGGIFRIEAGEQMKKRPMRPLIQSLRELGAVIECEEKEGYFPFKLDASAIRGGTIEIDTCLSTQFLSAMLMTGQMLKEDLKILFNGDRKKLPYVEMTVSVMERFGVKTERENNTFLIKHSGCYQAREYWIEPDVSSACYFYAMAVLLQCPVTVRGIHLNSVQGDIRFLEILERFGATVLDGKDGVTVIGNLKDYNGVAVNMNHCSDQTMTLVAIALFAGGLTKITGVEHIRMQESDRLLGIYNEVIRLGAKAEMRKGEITIFPMPNKKNEVEVETYGDHRMAMAFSLVGLRREGIRIKNPSCVEKTFKDYFNVFEQIYKEE